MNEIAIQVHGLSKQYTIGRRQEQYATLRSTLTEAAIAPFRRLHSVVRGRSPVISNDTVWALKDTSFEIMRGQVVGIIGRNGAGKTTLLKILSGITEPTEGYARVNGRVGSLLEVGTGFHSELTGRENIYLNGAILGMKKAEIDRKFDEIVAFAEVKKFIDTPVKHYSSGMYLRLAFAVAAHLEPEILLVDEVLAVGDNRFRRKCLGKMQEIGQGGRTILFVSHNMPAITRLCQRAILLDEGQVLQDGPSHAVVSTYLSSDSGTSAAREWPDLAGAPSNDMVRLCAVYVRNEAGQVVDTIDIRESFRIEIQYYNFSNEHFPYANIQFFNEESVCLFSSGDFTNLDWRHKSREFTGRVISSCVIPGNFLAEGQIRVHVALTTHNPNNVLIGERDAVSFSVIDRSQGDGARGEYAKNFPGVIRPLLEWRVRVDSDQLVERGDATEPDDYITKPKPTH